ncbi:tRNA lysidine(34) synthetase TilS [Candidatus Peregrinibacteria bacterium]|nr:tRNA lysidine(34) synthetase TilS [Candidatus Peregrinibacteria bacterium]
MFENLSKNQKVIVGVSGGPDSVYLFNQLLNSDLKPHIIVAHINHQTRGKQSENDAIFVKELAAKHDCIFEYLKLDFQKFTGNFEENARISRYDFFERIRQKHQADWILTAHHLNDQIETILFQMSRGAELDGFKGITEIDYQKKIYRPLLNIEKKEILKYLKQNKHNYRVDESNSNNQFSRNRIRNMIIPEFEKINPNFVKTFSSSFQNLQGMLEFASESIEQWIQNNCQLTDNYYSFNLQKFLEESLTVQKLIIGKLFKMLNSKGITKHQIKEIIKTLNQNKAGRVKEFGPDHQLKIIKNTKREVVIEKLLE